MGRPSGCLRVYREMRTRVGDIVVVQHARWRKRGGYVIRTACYGLTGVASISSCDVVRDYEAGSTADGQRNGIIIAIGLAVGLRRPGRVFLVDGEVRPVIDDVVVREHARGTECSSDVIGTSCYGLACRATVSRRDVVCRQEAASTARSQRIRICIAVGLARRIRSPGRILRIDGEVRTRIGDVVVGD